MRNCNNYRKKKVVMNHLKVHSEDSDTYEPKKGSIELPKRNDIGTTIVAIATLI